MTYKIVNIIANTNLHESLNLSKIARSLDDTEYEPEIYFALIYRLKNPKCSILINSSGKIIFSGANSIKNIKRAKDILFSKLHSLGYSPIEDTILIQNIVVSTRVQTEIHYDDISKNAIRLNLEFSCVKSRFYLKNKNPKFTIMVFKTGNCLIVGLKDQKTIKIALQVLNQVCQKI